MKWYLNRPMRRLVLGILSRFNPGDISIRHHHTGAKFFLHSYRHKGYWFHGKNREQETMQLFNRLIKPGYTVIEIGGHIGYISTYFASLVGLHRHVHVFEPGPNNLPYLRRNAEHFPNTHIHTQAVGNDNMQMPFYIENLTGQNNTLRQGFDLYKANAQSSYSSESYQTVMVDVVRLDDFLKDKDIYPDFIKVDVEGAEGDVVRGMKRCLETSRPGLMIEINGPEPEIFETLHTLNYVLFDDQRHMISDKGQIRNGNIFALHQIAHADDLKTLELIRS